MKLRLKRIARKETYTIGRLYVGGSRFCDTLEDTDRGLTSEMTETAIKRKKIPGRTAIPTGNYEILQTYSPKFGKNLPLLIDVKGFTGIRIHSGNSDADTEGCILVGENTKVGKVLNSRITLNRLLNMLSGQKNVSITIC